MTLPAEVFLRRLLLHILPDAFVRIRHFKFLVNHHRTENSEPARRLINPSPPDAATVAEPEAESLHEPFTATFHPCLQDQRGHLVQVEILPPISGAPTRTQGVDSS